MRELVATYKIVTPMFIGGADQSPADGIRPPSVKGALRFWWRALNWGRFWNESSEKEEPLRVQEALRALYRGEASLFGVSADDKNNTRGQGCFSLSISQPSQIEKIDDWPPNDPNHGASYMAYGILRTNDEVHRLAIKEGVEFTLRIVFKNNTKGCDIKQVNDAVEAWSLFGGLGGRSRRAMGSITLTSVDSDSALLTKDEYKNKIESILESNNAVPKAPFSALSKDSLFHLVNTGKNARTLVKKAGMEYKSFRGSDGLRGEKKVPFGLPLQGVDTNNRRASPLFFHIHELKDTNFAAINLFMPTKIFHRNNKYADISMDVVEQFVRRENI